MNLRRFPVEPPPDGYIQAIGIYNGPKPERPEWLICRYPNGLWEVLGYVDLGGGFALQRVPGTFLSMKFVDARGRLRDYLLAKEKA